MYLLFVLSVLVFYQVYLLFELLALVFVFALSFPLAQMILPMDHIRSMIMPFYAPLVLVFALLFS